MRYCFRSLRARFLAPVLLVASAFLVVLPFSSTGQPRNDPSENVVVTLWNASIDGVQLAIPEAYFGPRRLALTKKNLAGGKQKRLLLQFEYPGLKPLGEKLDSGLQNHRLSVMLTPTTPHYLDRFFGEPIGHKKRYRETENHRLGMRYYAPLNEASVYEAYYDKNDSNPSLNVLITCPIRQFERMQCKLRLETSNPKFSNQIAIDASIAKELLPEWQIIAEELRGFVQARMVLQGEWK